MLVLSQVVLSFGIPLALVPLVILTGRRDIMGIHVNGRTLVISAWTIAIAISLMNVFLIYQQFFLNSTAAWLFDPASSQSPADRPGAGLYTALDLLKSGTNAWLLVDLGFLAMPSRTADEHDLLVAAGPPPATPGLRVLPFIPGPRPKSPGAA